MSSRCSLLWKWWPGGSQRTQQFGWCSPSSRGKAGDPECSLVTSLLCLQRHWQWPLPPLPGLAGHSIRREKWALSTMEISPPSFGHLFGSFSDTGNITQLFDDWIFLTTNYVPASSLLLTRFLKIFLGTQENVATQRWRTINSLYLELELSVHLSQPPDLRSAFN